MAKASERDRYKYGVCTNRDKDGKPCPKCESKEVQKIRMGQDFVCEECKEPMRQVPPPKPPTPWGKIIGIIVAALIILGAAVYFFVFSRNSNSVETSGGGDTTVVDSLSQDTQVEVIKTDSIVLDKDSLVKPINETGTGEKIVEKEAIIDPRPTEGTINYPYGKYTGDIKDGKPHGNGTIEYTKSYKIISNKDYVASPGDKITGSFREGKINLVTWYQKDGKSIVIK
ncbi:MAG: hypothetical protein LBL58_12330 [Tannerellaceae bacterium]|jgi:hypothetical protein|nr:hypothetical protein [Tannerellaceae bacterium]